MLKVNYTFKAVTPLFTGSNENKGTVRTLRREKVLLPKSKIIKSNFKSKNERTQAVMDIIYSVYSEIDLKLKSDNYGFYDAYANKVKNATFVKTKQEFLTKLTESLDIQSMSGGNSKMILHALNKFNDNELIITIRNEHAYLMILLREYVAFFKDKNKVANAGFENEPTLSDFEQIVGIESIEKSLYHQLHTGGNISDSTEFEDIAKRDEYISNCPAISLFGSAIGNMTIHSDLSTVGARLRCIENNSGDLSYWEFLSNIFMTRHDTSKIEKNIEIVKKESKKERAADQMIFETETFCKGSKFDSMFILRTSKQRKDYDLIVSCFYRMLILWKKEPFVGGNSARDMGMIELDFDIPKNADKLYIDYLTENKDKIKKYFNV